MTYKGR